LFVISILSIFSACWHHSFSAVSILCVVAIVLTLVLILKLIFSFHEGDGVVEIDIRDKKKGGQL
jgi:hypothetical protein